MFTHDFGPVFDENSRVLILGSFPSVKSREEGFYYGHPRNRFWSVMFGIFAPEAPIGISIADKRKLLLENKIALWDVCASCEVKGSSDATITDVTPNDIARILSLSKIRRIYTNGKTADRLYRKLLLLSVGIEPCCLPSTSPANAAWSITKLREAWKNQFTLDNLL